MVETSSILLILGAWLSWGTYPVPFKSESAKKSDCDPFAFQFMKSSCVFLTSWLILTWKPFTFTIWGLVGAALWIPSGLLFITSVQFTGVAFASPVTNGCEVVVSFCWGAFFFKEEVHSWALAALALVIMIIGMIGISFSVNYEKIKAAREAKKTPRQFSVNVAAQPISEETSLMKDDQKTYLQEKEYKYVDQEAQKPIPDKQAEDKKKFLLGIFCAVLAGFFGGTQNVPMKHAPKEAHGIQYVISFGIGALLVITVFTSVYCVIRYFLGKGLPTVNPRLSFGPGILAGLLWSAGNICNIYTVYALGITVGFPLVKCNMMVAGCWGVFLYNEAPSIWMKILFIFSCIVLLGGVTLLSLKG